MTEQDFMEFMNEYWNTLKLSWSDKKKRIKALKSIRDLIDNCLED